MKTFSTALLTVALASGTFSATATAANDHQREQCRAQLAEYYGGAEDMRFVGERRYRDGTEMKFAVRNEDPGTGYSTTQLANCWLGAENYHAYSKESDKSMIADINSNPTSPVEDALPQ